MRQSAVAVGLAAMAIAAAGCQAGPKAAAAHSPATPTPSVTTPVASAPVATPSSTTAGHRQRHKRLAATLHVAPFDYHLSPVTTAELGKSWHRGCPVPASALTKVTMTYWGFDSRSHSGALVVNRSVSRAVVAAFRSMYLARFPIRRMQPIAAYGGDDDASMAADNTSAFNCRLAVSNGPKSWSMHAFGEAVDINTRENPYRLDGKVLPPSGAPYMDRSNVRPGMVVAGSAPVRAFVAVGWGWGGNWSSTPDYQHFSVNGR